MLRRASLFLIVAATMLVASPARAQVDNMDSVLFHKADTSVSLGSLPDDEAAFERPVVYNTARPDAAQWEAATADKAYAYRDKHEFIKKPEQSPTEPGWYKLLIGIFGFLGSIWGKALLLILLALIVGFIAYRIIAGHGAWLFGRRDVREAADDENEAHVSEESLLLSDWETRLSLALADGDSRLAVRYSYMHLLQALQQRGLIAYRPDKTNSDYYRELNGSMKQAFRAISRQYEWAWYGAFIPEAKAMTDYMNAYQGLKKTISNA